MTRRYYFHGDQVEDDPQKYFCAYCDAFVDINHFSETKHSGTDTERYERSKKGWIVLSKKSKSQLTRPKKSVNIFANLPKPKKPRTGSFYRWLMKQVDRDDPIGDLSYDVKRDQGFPVNTNSIEKIRNRLTTKLACEQAFQALEDAFDEFKDIKSVRSGLSMSLRYDVFKRDGYRCQICGASSPEGVKLEVDHKVSVAKGGGDDIDNLWTLCFACNRGKGTKNL